jgi:hypothetical protein
VRRNKMMGIFEATVYLEPIDGDNEKVKKH